MLPPKNRRMPSVALCAAPKKNRRMPSVAATFCSLRHALAVVHKECLAFGFVFLKLAFILLGALVHFASRVQDHDDMASSIGASATRLSTQDLAKGAKLAADMVGLELALDSSMLSREALLRAIEDFHCMLGLLKPYSSTTSAVFARSARFS